MSPLRGARARRALLGLVLSAAFATSCAGNAAPPGRATVASVVDGDTIEVQIGSRLETVRLLGIDTPETKHPTKPVECHGPEASARTVQLLPRGTDVELRRDVEARDAYGRLLAFVFVDGDRSINQILVEEGFADVLVIEPNGAHADELRAARDRARGERRGRWGVCPPE